MEAREAKKKMLITHELYCDDATTLRPMLWLRNKNLM